jgi:hypothetical protein
LALGSLSRTGLDTYPEKPIKELSNGEGRKGVNTVITLGRIEVQRPKISFQSAYNSLIVI